MGLSQSKNTSLNKTLSKSKADPHNAFKNEIHLEFIKLYRHSRSALHSATETLNDRLHPNTIQSLQRNLKSLNECCNKMEAYNKGIKDLVNERLTAERQHEYTIPNTDSDSIGSYINSRNSDHCEAPNSATSPPPNQGQGNEQQPNLSLKTGADVM